jgi:hypothetical protein
MTRVPSRCLQYIDDRRYIVYSDSVLKSLFMRWILNEAAFEIMLFFHYKIIYTHFVIPLGNQSMEETICLEYSCDYIRVLYYNSKASENLLNASLQHLRNYHIGNIRVLS